jgi:hypothetical protein
MLRLFYIKCCKLGFLGFVLVFAIIMAGCSSGSSNSDPTPNPGATLNPVPNPSGHGNIKVTITNATQYYSGKRLDYYITAFTIPTSENSTSGYVNEKKTLPSFSVSGDGPVTKTISQCVSPQRWVVIVEAKDSSDNKYYSGSTQVTLNNNETIQASVTLHFDTTG